MIQYNALLIMCECNHILFHTTPSHDGSHYKKQIVYDSECKP